MLIFDKAGLRFATEAQAVRAHHIEARGGRAARGLEGALEVAGVRLGGSVVSNSCEA